MYHERHMTKKSIIVISMLVLFMGGGGYYYWRTHYPFLYTFDQERDTQAILSIIKRNWHWMVSGDNYSPEFTLKYLAPSYDRRYLGTLRINVLRQGNDLLGFVAYYMKSPELGSILFLGVDERFRRHKYGERLLRYALKQLEQMGAHKVQLFARTTNIPALGLYTRVGFYKASISAPEGWSYYEYNPAKTPSREGQAGA